MSPDFDELVGTDLAPVERARLERVHELLVAAGPPPEPGGAVVALPATRRRGAAVAIAAALAVAAFALGAALADDPGGRTVDFVESMRGTPAAADSRGDLVVYEVDDAGNWPMELAVEGLPSSEEGGVYELWLTRDGRLDALCGSFRTAADGSVSVPLNAPYRFDESVGWVVVARGTTTPLLTS